MYTCSTKRRLNLVIVKQRQRKRKYKKICRDWDGRSDR